MILYKLNMKGGMCVIIVFNVGNYRRNMYGAYQPHYFYHPDNKEGVDKRTLVVWLAKDFLLCHVHVCA